MPFCDGCGAQVDDAHIRQRIERLELATRFRPIHISVLLIDAAPPARFEDYFYRAAADRSERWHASRPYFDALMKCAGLAPGSDLRAGEDAALAEFQRRGFFLIGAIECPLTNRPDPQAAIERAAPALLRRVRVSYHPKSVVLLSPLTQPLVQAFEDYGCASQLILHEGRPFAGPADQALVNALAPQAPA